MAKCQNLKVLIQIGLKIELKWECWTLLGLVKIKLETKLQILTSQLNLKTTCMKPRVDSRVVLATTTQTDYIKQTQKKA